MKIRGKDFCSVILCPAIEFVAILLKARYSNHLNGLKCPVFKWSALSHDQTIWKRVKKVSKKLNDRISVVKYSDGYCM